MKISSCNEYDQLKTCVVGDAKGARFPELDEIFDCNRDMTAWKETPLPRGMFPQHVIDEANEDLELLAHTLRDFGVHVLRPKDIDHAHVVRTHEWETDGMYNYCPRDILLVVDDLVVETPMAYRSRQMETTAFWKIKSRAIEDDARWIAAPRPRLLTQDNYVADGNLQLAETEPIFDAANVLRHNDDILYLVSNSGNRLGARWLQNILGKKYRVHIIDNLYAYAHIDSTISILRDGLVLLNGSRVNDANCPELFKKWDKIYVDDVVPQSFYQYPYASKWIAMNVLSIDPHTVIVDRNQTELIRKLEQWSITVVPLELRHSRTLGGGFHCVTLDLLREYHK
jgi:glycine amidinotransferase/scyllo-inosamine-4-phosphate amidinotransferase 1